MANGFDIMDDITNKIKPTIISYSEVLKYQICERQHYYRFIKGYAPREESAAVATGVDGHKLLQIFFEGLKSGLTKEQSWKVTNERALEEIKQDIRLLAAWTLVDNYIRDTEFKTESIFIENRFLLPADRLTSLIEEDPLHRVQIGFTPDIVFQRKGSFVDIEDYKFVQKAWGANKIERFSQLKIYKILLDRMGYNTSRCILRFFNVATGKSTVKHYTMNPVEEEILIGDFLSGVAAVQSFKEQSDSILKFAPRTMNYTACQFCPFNFPCSLEAEGKDASKTWATQYKKSPYDYTK